MELIVQLDGFVMRVVAVWQPLQTGGKNCYAWMYRCSPKPPEDEPVIYRHVLETCSAGVVPIYIGEGGSLAGPQKANICFQYGGPNASTPHGSTRTDVRNYISNRAENGWTEFLRVQNPVLNLSDVRVRKFLQSTLIVAYYWKHEELVRKYTDMPQFLNRPF